MAAAPASATAPALAAPPSPASTFPLDMQIRSLVDGFDALRDEYQRLWSRCQILESNVEAAKTQYSRLTSACPHKAEPLRLADPAVDTRVLDTAVWVQQSGISDAKRREQIDMACRLSQELRRLPPKSLPNGVTIHSGASADRASAQASSAAMPSISESPLEQDFTVAGTPSKLGCPFAAMANRRLSAHAASVVSRYRPEATATPRSSVSRINGRASSVAKASLMTDPIQAEKCAMDASQKPADVEASVQGSTGVCPIRFLDQHSPEEVAAYFESHKHELPRSHEICVKRYQSNEASVKQLDAKYGNLVSMIQGLGHKHAPLLPEKSAEHGEPGGDDDAGEDHASDEKIRQWASSVNGGEAIPNEPVDEERLPRFDRELKDVRLGESPSRPWGIQVPIHAHRRKSDASSVAQEKVLPEAAPADVQTEKPRGTCPFSFDKQEPKVVEEQPKQSVHQATPGTSDDAKPLFVQTEDGGFQDFRKMDVAGSSPTPQMLFTGPVFIGYSLEQAKSLLQTSHKS